MMTRMMKMALSAVLAVAGTAYATPHIYQSAQTGDASDKGTWLYWDGVDFVDVKGTAIPVPGADPADTVEILTGHVVTFNSATSFQDLTVDAVGAAYGTVILNANLTLQTFNIQKATNRAIIQVADGVQLEETSSATINGMLDLQGGIFKVSGAASIGSAGFVKMNVGTGSSPEVNLNSQNLTMAASPSVAQLWILQPGAFLSGSGDLIGQDTSSEIRIDATNSNMTFTNNAKIRGALTIDKVGSNTGVFANAGKVIADAASATLLLDLTLSNITDPAGDSCGGGARWQSTGSGSVLEFGAVPSASVGKFNVTASSTLLLSAPVTCRGLNSSGTGTITGTLNFVGGVNPC